MLLSPVHLLLRPALVPITGGLLGLFSGTYDLTLLTVGSITNMKPAAKCSFNHKIATFSSGLGISGVFLYGRWLWDPPPLVPKLDQQIAKTANNMIQRHIRQSMQMIRFFASTWPKELTWLNTYFIEATGPDVSTMPPPTAAQTPLLSLP